MGKKNQLSLPGFTGEEESRFPQPHIRKFRDIRRYEFLYRPFDLRFRGLVNKWLEHLKRERGVNYEKIIDEPELEIMTLYLYPQGRNRKWLSQEEVAQRLKEVQSRKIRKLLVTALMRLWRTIKLGAS